MAWYIIAKESARNRKTLRTSISEKSGIENQNP